MKKLLICFCFLLISTGCAVNQQAVETGFLDRTIVSNGVVHNYQVYIPNNYDASEEWPVILFLHGAGERGSDGLKQTQVGLGRAIRLNPERWQSIVVFPQAPVDEMWRGDTAEMAMAALDQTIDNFSIDESRVYLTGLSLGGGGTWYLGYEHGERFAALVVVCGFIEIDSTIPSFVDAADSFSAVAGQIADKPIWIVHGDADVVVPVEQSRMMAAALRSAGADVTYTELPGVNHNAWDPAYANEELIEWLFQQSL